VTIINASKDYLAYLASSSLSERESGSPLH
jgi:hypothetical protein